MLVSVVERGADRRGGSGCDAGGAIFKSLTSLLMAL